MFELVMKWILDRLSESSTYRGLALVGSAAGIAVSPDQAGAIAGVGMAVAGAINVFRRE